jgi:hypothetical protein
VAVFAHMSLGSFMSMLFGVGVMALRRVGVMRGLFVIARIVMLCGSVMLFSGVFVMFRSFAVMLGGFLGHDGFSPGESSQLHTGSRTRFAPSIKIDCEIEITYSWADQSDGAVTLLSRNDNPRVAAYS